MTVDVIRIGNSRGIRIPKTLIDQCGLGDKVELRVEKGRLIVAPQRQPRQGWEEALRAAGPGGADELLLDMPPTRFDMEEWEW
jgi:antitoxin MazE